MIFLFGLIIIGYILRKSNAVPENCSMILSKLENNLFIPALVLGTFISKFTITTLKTAWKILLISFAIEILVIFITRLISKFLAKDNYTQNIYSYGLCFSNFGFMGNAVVLAIFPEYFTIYLIFTLVLWSLIYIYGVPFLLLPSNANSKTIKERLKPFANPMFIATGIGMISGILLSTFNLSLPTPIMNIITVSGDCMSPIAMLLTGMTIAQIDIKKTIKIPGIYLASVLRLIVYPLIGIAIFALPFNFPKDIIICTVATLAMPLGLNSIVVPAAHGKDTSVAAGMALVSHILSVITIPVIFIFLQYVL